MRTHSPLVVDVHEILEHPGIRRPIVLDAPVPGLEVGLVAVPSDLHFDLVGEALDGGILVQGTVEGSYTGTCRRCLASIEQPFTFRASEVFRPKTEVWEEGYVVDEGHIDLERLVRDNVGLNLPINPLCKDDCAGLCPRCGADLNQGDCGCPTDEGDPRWSALRELRGRLNG